MTRVVCALSGGGAKSAAHLGAVKALSEHGLEPSHYVATSMGAVVAACLAAGLTYEESVLRLARLRRRDVAATSPAALFGFLSGSLLRDEPLRRTIARLVPARRFDELRVPLTVTAVDLTNGQLTLFGEGGREHVPLVDALYASCALPVYFPPARIGGRLYADGGLRAAFPIDIAASFAPDLLYAVNVGPSLYEEPVDRRAAIPPLVRMHGSALRVMMAAQTETVLERWRAGGGDRDGRPDAIIVQPVVEAESTFALDMVVHYIEAGYRAAFRELSARDLPR